MHSRGFVLILTPYARPHVGGVSTFVHNLAEALRTYAGWRCRIVAKTGTGSAEVVECSDSLFRFLVEAAVGILRSRPDVVHAHSHWYTLLPAAILKLAGFRFRLVFSFHTMHPAERPVRFRGLLEFLLSRCNMVTFVSGSLENQILGLFDVRASRSLLPPGVAPRASPQSTPTGPRIPVIGFAGPLTWRGKAEGLALLLDALAVVRTEFPSVRLLVAGSGEFGDSLRHRAEALGVGPSVDFLGSMDSMDGFWSRLSVYAHISLQEGLPLSLLEAMAHGLPVIATRVGGIPEVLRTEVNGVLVEPDVAEVASGLRRILNEPARAADMGRAGRTTVETEYSLERLAERALRIYGG